MGSKGLKEFHPTTKAQEKQIPSPGSQLEGGIDDTFMSSLKFLKTSLGKLASGQLGPAATRLSFRANR